MSLPSPRLPLHHPACWLWVLLLGWVMEGMLPTASGSPRPDGGQFDSQRATKLKSGTGLTPAFFAWQYDALGSVTGQDETWAAAGSGQPARTRSTVNTYDLARRLDTETITEVVGGSASPPVTTTYSYDAAHNRTRKLVEGGGGAEDWTYTYNVANQLTQSVKTHAADPVETTTYGYDTNGNRTSRDKRIGGSDSYMTLYQWNAWDRLIGVNLMGAKKFSYTYDDRARRVAVAQATSGGLVARYTAVTFSGGLSVAEFESTTAVVGTVAAVQYIRGPDMGGGVGGLLRTVRNPVSASTTLPVAPTAANPATHRYNLSNGRGDIVAQSNAVGELTWTASYEAYGKRTKETGANADKQRANSKDEDPTGLLNEGFRYRDLETGVWLSRDPAGFVDGPNLYAYVKQNPWSKFDPNGLWSWSAFGKGLAWGAGAAAAIALAPVLLPAMAATAVTAAIVTVGVASTAVVGTELATNRHVEVGWSGVGLSESTLTADERDERVSGLVGGLVGGGLTGRFAGPKLRCLGNPKSNDQALVDSLVSERSSRVAEGSETGQATFSVAQSRGQTTAITESAKGVNGTHAEVQSSALARSGNAPMTVAVDQIPCPNCTRDVVAGLPAGSRVVVPANAPNSTGSPKTAARDGANEGMPVVPRTLIEKPYTQKLTPPCSVEKTFHVVLMS